MTTPIRQFILKRGNTEVSSQYIGPVGEITYDTGFNAVRIHDGITPGGNLMPSGTLISVFQSNITALESNVSILFANAATQAGYISTLQSNVATLQSLASSAGAVPPDLPSEGALWYDDVSGRLYVYFDGFWIDASPDTVYTLPVATGSILGGVKIGGNLTIDGNGVLSATTNLGNLTIADTTITTVANVADIVLSTRNGTAHNWTFGANGTTTIPDGLILPVSTISESTASVEVIVEDLTLDATVDYSTGEGDNIAQNTYGTHDQINHPWAVYRFTTIPSPVLQIEDVIAGDAVPVGSTVLVVGTGIYQNIAVTDHTITGLVPQAGAVISVARPVTNAALQIATDAATDIALIAGTDGRIVVSSSIIPVTTGTYELGTPTRRFGRLWLGGGSIYIEDEVTGADLRITAINGDLVVAGGAGLEVGQFVFRDNEMRITDPNTEIFIGQIGAPAPVSFRRTIQVRNSDDSHNLFRVDQAGTVEIQSNITTDPTKAAVSIIGARTGDYVPPNNLGVLLQLTGSSTAPSRIYHDSYGAANYSAFIGRHARGNVLTASQTLAGDIISRVGANPHNNAGFAPISTMRIDFVNAETQTTIAQGSKLEFWTTPIGSTTIGKRVTIDGSDIVLTSGGAGGVTFADGSRQTVAFTSASLASVNANITAANVNISTLFSNAVTQQTEINSISNGLTAANINISTLFSNAAAQATDLNTLFANAAAQQTDIVTLGNGLTAANANIAILFGTTQTFGPIVTGLTANAGTQQTQINSITANAVTTINAGTGITVSRTNGTVGINATGVRTVTGTANQILVSNIAQNITLSLPQDINTNSTVTFSNVTVTGNLNIEGNIISSQNISLESKILYLANTATSGSELDGGGIVLGNVNAAFARSILYDYNGNWWDTDGAGLKTLDLHATDAYVDTFWNNGASHFGANALVINYDNAEVQIDSNRNDFSQLIHQNHSSGTSASTDFVAANDIGDDSTHYIDMGINSSSYTNAVYNIGGPNDGYLYVNGGNLTIGTQSTGNVIKFHTSGTTASNLRVTITDDGLAIVNNVTVGGTLIFADGSTQTTSANTTINNFTAVFDANLGTVTTNISTLFSNAATQQIEINTINSNVTAANLNISTLFSNAASQAVDLNTLFANAAVQAVEINGINSNVTAANLNISTLFSNAASQAVDLNTLFANAAVQAVELGNLNANIVATNVTWNANAATQDAAINALRANVTAANTRIQTIDANLGATYGNVTQLQNALGTQGSDIASLRGNITAANTRIQTIDANVGSYQLYANANIGTITTNVTTLFANAGTQQTEINALRANITAANSAIITANSAVVSYVNTLNTAMTANVNAANTAIVTANTGMKSYVDAAVSSSSLYAFGHFAVAGQSTVNATNGNDTANLVAGTGISITTSGKDITFATDGASGVSELYGGNNIVLSDSTGNITIQRIDGIQSVVTGNSSSTFGVTTTNQYIGTTRSATGTGTVTLPAGSTVPVGRQYIIKDEGGSSGSYLRRITVAASGSDTIDGSATRGITSNYGSLTVLWTGTRWSVI